MDALKIGEFLGNSIINDLKNAYRIDVLEVLLQGGLDLFTCSTLNDGLVLIRDKFGDYVYDLAHDLIVPFFPMQY